QWGSVGSSFVPPGGRNRAPLTGNSQRHQSRLRRLAVSYSGHAGTGVHVQAAGATTTAGMFGVMATNPMSLIGEFGPENTALTAPVTGPTVPSYDCGRSGPAGAPGTVMGPSVSALVGAMKPLPARLHPSPFMSTKAPDAPAVVGSALRR